MGIAERKEREKVELREHILQGAMDVFTEVGYEQATIRKIAQRIEYSPGTIYLYFTDKDAILFELHKRAFGELEGAFAPLLTIDDPVERIRQMGHTYIRFALDKPMLYELMFILQAPMKAEEVCDDWEEGHRSFLFLVEAVKQAQQANRFSQASPEVIALSFWSSVHGLAALYLRDRFKMFAEEEVPQLIAASIDAMIHCFSRGAD